MTLRNTYAAGCNRPLDIGPARSALATPPQYDLAAVPRQITGIAASRPPLKLIWRNKMY
jgi:hypothetical protein